MLSKVTSCRNAGMLWFKEVNPTLLGDTGPALTKTLCVASTFQSINNSDVYHEKWWYTSQLFDPDWSPRETLEHAPPA